MDIHRSEEEQVEALKRWWDRNGRAVIVGVAVFVALVLGWRGWVQYQQGQSQNASILYERMLGAVESEETAKAREHGRSLIGEYGGTPYAGLAGLYLARLAVDEDKLEAAAGHLQWVMDNTDMAGIGHTARVRLARVRLAQDRADAALALVEGEAPAGFEGVYAEARGDILAARGDTEGAGEAYDRALEAYSEAPMQRSVVRMKRQDLAGGGEG